MNCYFCKKDITKDLECIECQGKNKFTKLTNNVDFDKLNKVDTSIIVMENTEYFKEYCEYIDRYDLIIQLIEKAKFSTSTQEKNESLAYALRGLDIQVGFEFQKFKEADLKA